MAVVSRGIMTREVLAIWIIMRLIHELDDEVVTGHGVFPTNGCSVIVKKLPRAIVPNVQRLGHSY